MPVRDAALVAEAQRVQHYQLAGLGVLREIADALEIREDAQLLDQSLRELEGTNLRLMVIGERIYPSARKAAYANVPS